MTIGIAAHGPNAGRAVIRALAAVEAVGRGAISGFVSLVALTEEGVVRAETQRGGVRALFGAGPDDIPDKIANACLAGLMSSGPDRPNPLSQFTPARAGVGLVTGHRLPNMVGAGGLRLNDEVIELMASGLTPEEAVERVTSGNPGADAGIIAVSVTGAIHLADTRHVRRRQDIGRHLLRDPASGAVVGVLHNSIMPVRPLASLAAEVALDVMAPLDEPTGWITLAKGVPVTLGSRNALVLGASGIVRQIVVEDDKFMSGEWGLGIGQETQIVMGDQSSAVMLYEPYMVVRDGQLVSIDGAESIVVPIRT